MCNCHAILMPTVFEYQLIYTETKKWEIDLKYHKTRAHTNISVS